MYDITAFGETLIDFTESGLSAGGNRLFEQNPGGAVANVLCAAAKFGKKTCFMGMAGNDMHGRFLKETMENAGVDTRGLVLSDDVFTTLAFVALGPDGDRSFSFARKPGADTCFAPENIDRDILKSTRVFHVGSLSLTDEPARSATFEAVRCAREAGAVISYDPNYRASLWPDVETACQQMRSLVPFANVMKLSDEETELLTGVADVKEAARLLRDQGVSIVAVTMGGEGAYVLAGEGEGIFVPGFSVPVVDTTGAGDSFWGGVLTCLLDSGKAPQDVTTEEAAVFARFGNAVAALCIQKTGAIPAMPEKEAVDALLGE